MTLLFTLHSNIRNNINTWALNEDQFEYIWSQGSHAIQIDNAMSSIFY